MKYTVDQLVLLLYFVVNAYNYFPAPPLAFTELTKNEMVQWALFLFFSTKVVVLRPKLSLLMTVAMYLLTKQWHK